MEKNSSTFNFKQWPLGLIIGLFLIFAFEIFNIIIENRIYPYPYDGLRMKIKNQIAQNPTQQFEVIILGDCYNLHGIIPNIIKEKTGLSTFNLATHANQTILASTIMWKNYLKKHNKKPKYLIVNYLPQTFILQKESLYTKSLPHMYEFKNGNIRTFLKEFGLGQTIRFWIPSLKNQAFLRSKLLPLKLAKKKEIAKFINSIYEEKGYYSKYGEAVYTGNRGKDGHQYVIEPSPFFDKNFKEILSLANQYNIKVIFPMFSAPPDWYKNLYNQNRMIDIYGIYLTKLQKEYPMLYLYQTQPYLNEKRFYRNTTHLNNTGAPILSNVLSKIILDHELR